MTIDYAALNTEITIDPESLGYAFLITDGNDQGIADLLNAVSSSWPIERDLIEAYEVIDATDAGDWTALTAAERVRYQTITGAGQINVKSTNVRAAFGAMFGAGTTTRANLLALQSRNGSRAEILFGSGTRITHTDVAIALGRGQ